MSIHDEILARVHAASTRVLVCCARGSHERGTELPPETQQERARAYVERLGLHPEQLTVVDARAVAEHDRRREATTRRIVGMIERREVGMVAFESRRNFLDSRSATYEIIKSLASASGWMLINKDPFEVASDELLLAMYQVLGWRERLERGPWTSRYARNVRRRIAGR